MEAFLMKQEDMYERLFKAYTAYKKSPKDRITTSYIESRLENLEKLSGHFETTHFQLVSTVTKEDRNSLEYFSKDVFGRFEETYTEYKSKLKDDLKRINVPLQSASKPEIAEGSMVKCEAKLPQIQLPKFSGSYEDWQAFYDMFRSLIHKNSNLSAVQKLHYLKSSLSGEPETLLKNLPTTDTNYEEAWKQLTRRYNNKRFNANEILKRLFSQKNIFNESSTSIKQLLDTTTACLKSLNNMNIKTESWDPIINYLVVTKLDTESRKLWELQISQNESEELPTWTQLVKFLETRFRTLEMIGEKQYKANFNATPSKTTPNKKTFHATVQDEKKKIPCVMCPNHHLLYLCPKFQSQSPQERTDFIQSKRLCFNCFSSTHSVKNCRHSTSCRRCGRRHNTLLHFDRNEIHETAPVTSTTSESPVSAEPQSTSTERRVAAHFVHQREREVLLATARVKAVARKGSQIIRVLIDQGSEASFVTEATVQSLGLKRVPVNGLISGVGEGETRTKSMVSLRLESLHNPEFSVQINAFVLSTLTSFLPSNRIVIKDWKEIESLALADPHYGSPERIDLILGVEVHSEIILGGLLKHPNNCGPIAQNTQFGWVLSGRVDSEASSSNRRVINLHMRVKEDALLQQFWEIEREPDSIHKKMTSEERKCEEIYESTTERNEEGRYKVRLPFRESDPECLYGQSDVVALRRFKSLERRLQRSPSLRVEYINVMQDYIEQNHMEEITELEEINKPDVVYLPHQAVVRQDKDTSKVRVVFDASCKGVNGVSLNDTLLVGPKLQQDLRHVLMRWRRHPFCVVADLVQMYRQILVHDEDTNYQRILWKSDPKQPIQHYRLLRLTFGTSCAPYLAVKSLQQLAKDESHRNPLAAAITLKDYYMDDLLTGSETEDEVVEIYNKMNELMASGGFCLRKWCTNSDKLLNHIKNENLESKQTLILKTDNSVKILGICWNKNTDNFEYTYLVPDSMSSENVTKRKVLSEIARLYDPLGWISPVIITAKIFIQKLWRCGLEWDQVLTPELGVEWNVFRTDLMNVRDVVIPRWLKTRRDDYVELHVFADASQAAYAAVVYLKARDASNNIQINLVTAKTKVAPVEKEISIPRMELCAAVLATKLIYEVSQIMEVPKEQLFAWSDSTVVLAWLSGEPSRWTTFVSNRVSEILTMLDRNQWNHVRTDQNPADCSSRGMSIRELKSHGLWWNGPDFLYQHLKHNTNETFETHEEQRAIKTLTAVVKTKEEFIWARFSNLQRALRVLSFCKRFSNLRLPRDQRETSKIPTRKEINEIMNICIKETQGFYFEEELKQLRSHGYVTKKSHLHTLCPFFDENGILRVGGRIDHSAADFNKKHPVIMPGESHFTKLLVLDAHHRTLHGGPQVMLNFLRSKFWIIRGRDQVKKCYRECLACLRYSRQNNNQFMGQLPKVRVTPTRPFKSAGVDFTGHINIRFSPGRGSRAYKGYICVFICMATRAIHLEAVSDLTAQGFIAAFRRFVSRRGHCEDLYSDNGTNFVGADKELREMFQKATSQLPIEIRQLLSREGTTWHFIPPHAPNFGGLWEAGVRSTKSHLKRVIGDSTLTFEELSTVLTQVEACLNSRPLYCVSDNPNDPLPLTPGHFLIGEPLIVIPDEDHSREQVSGLQRWKLTQKMVTDFWKRWSDEYLVTLNQRYKWFTKKSEPEIDDLVIIRDSNVPPSKWLLGKIVEKHPGKDNITRVVTIKTKNGICKRPCNKLCLLPKDCEI